jgi:hypothetical protein
MKARSVPAFASVSSSMPPDRHAVGSPERTEASPFAPGCAIVSEWTTPQKESVSVSAPRSILPKYPLVPVIHSSGCAPSQTDVS